ncbi:MAG: DUF302 domain-containing protein [Candidatus Dadabacteria bacterium]|nr:DUF302 domain-containing protein [Candidatus Dadabacteria bacterium]
MEIRKLSNYSFGDETNLSFDESVEEVTEMLKEQGFGVLTEIDAKIVLKEKLGIDRRPYKILDACNPNFAHRAIEMEPDIGTLLPCNVLVYEKENGKVMVSAMNPEAALSLVDNEKIEEIAKEVRNRIKASLSKL